MKTNTDITLYRYNAVTTGFDRIHIKAAFWQECKAANVLESGMQTADSTVVYIPIMFKDDAPSNCAKDMLVKGDCAFVFDNSNAKSISDSLKQFKAERSFVTVSSIDTKDYGTANLQHIKISAR